MDLVCRSDGVQLRLGAQVGRGGEGTVFSVQDVSNLVVKLYREDLRATRREKIELMVQLNNPVLADFVAWPVFAIYERAGAGGFCGFAMPKIGPDFIPIHNLYGPSSRRQKFPGRDWRFLVRAAENLAAAVAEVHAAGHVVGDINHSNALVNNDALVRFIDADSFQVQHAGTRHRCTVGVPEFTPPELQGLNLASVDRSAQHDLFGLAVLIFKLLFMGRHPFAGRFTRGDVSLPDAIKQGLFAYSPTLAGEATPPPNTLDLKDVGTGLASMFDNAFLTPLSVDRRRPDGHTWVRALRQLQEDVRPCGQQRSHFYPQSAGSCIWCDFGSRGIDYFPDSGLQAPPPPIGVSAGDLAIDDALVGRLWAAVVAVPRRPGFDESMPHRTFDVAPLPPPKPIVRLDLSGPAGGWILVGGVGAFVFFGGVGLFLVGGLLLGVVLITAAIDRLALAWSRRDPQRRLLEEQLLRRRQLRPRIAALQSVVRDAIQEHEASWQALMSDLDMAHQELIGRDAAKAAAVRGVVARLEHRQREAFLRSKLLRAASIRGVGDALTSSLMSYGFESAYDVLGGSAGSVKFSAITRRVGAPRCPICGGPMIERFAHSGPQSGRRFWGCSRYPGCRGTRNFDLATGAGPSPVGPSGGLLGVPGIGSVRAAAITKWAREVEGQFHLRLSPAALADEERRIEGEYAARVQELAHQLREGPAELMAINNHFMTQVSSAMVQYRALSRDW